MADKTAGAPAVEFEPIEGVNKGGRKFKSMSLWIYGTEVTLMGEENWRNLAVLLGKPEACADLKAAINAHLGLVPTTKGRIVAVGDRKSYE